MHIQIVPNRGSPPTVLLRESYRDGGKVKKRRSTVGGEPRLGTIWMCMSTLYHTRNLT